MGQTVLKAGFNVNKDNSIEEVMLFLEVYDIDQFYLALTEKFGTPGTLSLSEFYIKQHGFEIPLAMDKMDVKMYDSIPKPQVKDYKNLKNVNWYKVNSDSNNIETNLIVRNHLESKIGQTEVHEVNLIFRKSHK